MSLSRSSISNFVRLRQKSRFQEKKEERLRIAALVRFLIVKTLYRLENLNTKVGPPYHKFSSVTHHKANVMVKNMEHLCINLPRAHHLTRMSLFHPSVCVP